MLLNSLSSLGPNLVLFKILIFHEDILTNACKEIPSILALIFPLYTLIPNSEFEKKNDENSFSLRKMQLEGFAMARSIDNFFTHYLHYLYLKYAYKK